MLRLADCQRLQYQEKVATAVARLRSPASSPVSSVLSSQAAEFVPSASFHPTQSYYADPGYCNYSHYYGSGLNYLCQDSFYPYENAAEMITAQVKDNNTTEKLLNILKS